MLTKENRYVQPSKPKQPCLHCKTMFKAKGTKQKFCANICWLNFKHLNKIATRRGVPHSEDTKLKMSLAKKKWFSENTAWQKGKKLFNRSGDNHHNWKGGVTPNNKLERESLEYKRWRNNVLVRDDYTCQVCDAVGSRLHVDHIKPFANYPNLRYDELNGRTLCVPCHYYVTYKRKMPQGSKWSKSYGGIRC